jgi:hypothetical protein
MQASKSKEKIHKINSYLFVFIIATAIPSVDDHSLTEITNLVEELQQEDE